MISNVSLSFVVSLANHERNYDTASLRAGKGCGGSLAAVQSSIIYAELQ